MKLVKNLEFNASIWENFLPKISGGDQKSICGTLYTFIHKTDTLVLDLSYVLQVSSLHCTHVRFASFLSGGFTTMAVINPPERKLAKRTSVHWADQCRYEQKSESTKRLFQRP